MEMKVLQGIVSSIVNQLCYTTTMFTKGVKIRIYPTEQQKVYFENAFGCCRKVSMSVDVINHVTVKRTPIGKYFAVLNVDFEPDVVRYDNDAVGIDVGLKSFYVDSKGCSVANPKYYIAGQRKLRREQRRLARKCKGSSNYSKQRRKIALAHEKVLNQRDDFLHKQSLMLVRENQTICIETLNVEGMLANHRLAKSIADASWSKFFTMLKYKGSWYGSDVVSVPTFYASSQTCSVCGEKSSLVKDLKVRKWTCSRCGSTHDRDTNAAINILNKGLELRDRHT